MATIAPGTDMTPEPGSREEWEQRYLHVLAALNERWPDGPE